MASRPGSSMLPALRMLPSTRRSMAQTLPIRDIDEYDRICKVMQRARQCFFLPLQLCILCMAHVLLQSLQSAQTASAQSQCQADE